MHLGYTLKNVLSIHYCVPLEVNMIEQPNELGEVCHVTSNMSFYLC